MNTVMRYLVYKFNTYKEAVLYLKETNNGDLVEDLVEAGCARSTTIALANHTYRQEMQELFQQDLDEI